MAKDKKVVKRVTLTGPSGASVTVSEESADKFKARGYKVAAKRSTAKAAPKADK